MNLLVRVLAVEPSVPPREALRDGRVALHRPGREDVLQARRRGVVPIARRAPARGDILIVRAARVAVFFVPAARRGLDARLLLLLLLLLRAARRARAPGASVVAVVVAADAPDPRVQVEWGVGSFVARGRLPPRRERPVSLQGVLFLPRERRAEARRGRRRGAVEAGHGGERRVVMVNDLTRSTTTFC
eukprot:31184-Pelagococcus_subviridis.AAC.7